MAKTIIDDALSYLWKQYKNKAIKDGGMNAFYGYMGIRFPEYYFYINKGEHILNICRFE